MENSVKKNVTDAINMLESLLSDTTIPRNIRKIIEEAKARVGRSDDEKELEVNIAQAVYLLDDALNDINLPFHARTDIMSVISELEEIKEKIK